MGINEGEHQGRVGKHLIFLFKFSTPERVVRKVFKTYDSLALYFLSKAGRVSQ